MPRFDDTLLVREVDLRSFAPAIAAQPDAVNQVKSAMDAMMRTRAVVFGVDTIPSGQADHSSQLVEVGMEAARKIASDPGAELSADERIAYEAVVRLTERPALLIRDDSFPDGLSPSLHPAMERVPVEYEPKGLGEATGRGAEPSA